MLYFIHFTYSTAAPANVTNVVIDLNTVNIDNGNVNFILNWDEPFANFDPIVNYTITINCTDVSCPVMFSTDNITTTANVSFITDLSMITPLSVTANNIIGTSDPTTIKIGGKLCIICACLYEILYEFCSVYAYTYVCI